VGFVLGRDLLFDLGFALWAVDGQFYVVEDHRSSAPPIATDLRHHQQSFVIILVLPARCKTRLYSPQISCESHKIPLQQR
jgi:hypothetical protein